jgi:nucleoside-diphosphate-sugar epimerase
MTAGGKGAGRVLVTGATGFIGRTALEPLRALGFEVHAVSRTGRPAGAASAGEVRWHAADLLAGEGPGLVRALAPTHLLHFAWYAEHGKFWDSPLNLDWLRVSLELLRAFADAGGTRFVGAGTCAEYDWSGDRYDELETPLRPASLYGAAKASAWLTGEAFARDRGLSFAWGRVFHLFGPGEPPTRIVPALCRAHLFGEAMDCTEGTQARDFLPVEAVGEAFARLCAAGAQGAFNIGSGRGVTLREISATIASLAGAHGDVRFGARHDAGPARLVPEISRLRAVGWEPPAGLEEGLLRSIREARSSRP